MLNEVEYCSAQSPASNHYKPKGPEDAILSQHSRSPAANLNRNKAPMEKMIPLKRVDAPGPHHYKEKDEKWKKLSTVKHFTHDITVSKEKANRFLDHHVKAKNFIPGVAKYKTEDMNAFNKLARGPS